MSIKQKLLESHKEFFEPESPNNQNRNTGKMGDKLEQTPLVGTLVSSSEAELEIEIDNSNEFLNLQAAIIMPVITPKEIEEEKAKQTVASGLPASLQAHAVRVHSSGSANENKKSNPSPQQIIDQAGEKIEHQDDDQDLQLEPVEM